MCIIEERTEENSLVSRNPADEVLREKYLKNRSFGNYFGRIGTEQHESYQDAAGRITESAQRILEDTLAKIIAKDLLDTSFVDSMYKELDID
ncbi:hypothetical protein EVB55_183 [Rhizobium phage RHph_Y68]|uniref:Uncharacterized protein n=1 Tax=Rhizobium phage RHph_Y68 TaxID=2509787 RepID=A0A7S5USE3_9CAUD|nr:hypothetical protein PP934_gp183 [Rhizobium phage RHph_Y68]QIG68118.1 hypothetical protein EVB55_183 [Rhizobium phage RHph_Y68]